MRCKSNTSDADVWNESAELSASHNIYAHAFGESVIICHCLTALLRHIVDIKHLTNASKLNRKSLLIKLIATISNISIIASRERL